MFSVSARKRVPRSGLSEGGFLKDSNGSIVIPKLDENMLYRLARSGGGQYARMTVDSADIDAILLASSEAHAEIEETDSLSRLWIEQGPWLLVFMLPFIALIFRRGYGLLAVLVLCIPAEENLAQTTEENAENLEAGAWESLWKRPNQIARESYDSEQYQRAANIAQDPFLEGMAYYRMDEFEVAERYFSQQDTADAHYNRGNALARQNKLEEGIAAYDRALTLDPDMEDAAYNKALLEDALKQQQEQQQQEQDNQNESDEQEQTESDQQETPEESEGESEEQQSEQQQSSEQESEQSEESELSDRELSEEEKQALEQWLRRVPDDPGGLLRRKFMLEHRRRLAEQAKRGSGS